MTVTLSRHVGLTFNETCRWKHLTFWWVEGWNESTVGSLKEDQGRKKGRTKKRGEGRCRGEESICLLLCNVQVKVFHLFGTIIESAVQKEKKWCDFTPPNRMVFSTNQANKQNLCLTTTVKRSRGHYLSLTLTLLGQPKKKKRRKREGEKGEKGKKEVR